LQTQVTLTVPSAVVAGGLQVTAPVVALTLIPAGPETNDHVTVLLLLVAAMTPPTKGPSALSAVASEWFSPVVKEVGFSSVYLSEGRFSLRHDHRRPAFERKV